MYDRRRLAGRRAERAVHRAARIEDRADARRRVEERRHRHVVETVLQTDVLRRIGLRRLRVDLHARIAERVQRVEQRLRHAVIVARRERSRPRIVEHAVARPRELRVVGVGRHHAARARERRRELRGRLGRIGLRDAHRHAGAQRVGELQPLRDVALVDRIAAAQAPDRSLPVFIDVDASVSVFSRP